MTGRGPGASPKGLPQAISPALQLQPGIPSSSGAAAASPSACEQARGKAGGRVCLPRRFHRYHRSFLRSLQGLKFPLDGLNCPPRRSIKSRAGLINIKGRPHNKQTNKPTQNKRAPPRLPGPPRPPGSPRWRAPGNAPKPAEPRGETAPLQQQGAGPDTPGAPRGTGPGVPEESRCPL